MVDVGGLYGVAPTCYLSLIARVSGFERSDLDRELYERRSLRRMRALRGSGFMIPVHLVDVVVAAEEKRDWYLETVLKMVGNQGTDQLISDVVGVLDGRTLSTRQIRSDLSLEGPRAEALKYLMSSLTGQRVITSAGIVGGWRSNQYTYALWEDWFPDLERRDLDPGSARAEIAGWYLYSHGPGTVDDFKWWSGLTAESATSALEESSGELIDGDLWDVPSRAHVDSPKGLRLLPVWDTALVTQISRRRMVDEKHYRFVYDRDGNLTSTIAIDGEVVGVWDRKGDEKNLLVKAAPLESFGSSEWAAIETEAMVVGSALGVDEVVVERFDEPADLHAAGRNRFLSPLSGT